MNRGQVCRTCGQKFRPPLGRPRGWIDECEDCTAERLDPRPATRAGPVCESCHGPVLKAGDVHYSCVEKASGSVLSCAEIGGVSAVLGEHSNEGRNVERALLHLARGQQQRHEELTKHLRGPETLAFTRDEFDELVQLQKRRRWDWPAVFSTNEYGDIWPFTTYGWTPDLQREQLRDISKIIDAVAAIYRLKVRPEGGRFFIDEHGAFYKNEDEASPPIQFITFEVQGKETALPH